jgi:hypothetical protein
MQTYGVWIVITVKKNFEVRADA